MKLMAIDYGERRVGVASTDEMGDFALPRAVWPNDKTLVDKVLKFREEEEIGKIIIGESRDLNGNLNPIQKAIDSFKSELETRLSAQSSEVEIVCHPEVFTTLEARRLQGRTEMTDASAAALILKSYLESR